MSNRNIYFGSLEDQVIQSIGAKEQEQEQEQEQEYSINYNNLTNSNNKIKSHATNEEFDRRSLAKTLKIPTLDSSVRDLLISLNQPVTLFGEGPAERRDRLRLMASKAITSLPKAFELFPVLKTLIVDEEGAMAMDMASNKKIENSSPESDDEMEEFYVPGSMDLLKTRSFLLEDSISRARQRALKPKIDHQKEMKFRTDFYEKIKSEMELRATHLDSLSRPLSSCVFSGGNGNGGGNDGNGNSEILFTGDWSGRVLKFIFSKNEGNIEISSSSCQLSTSQRITTLAEAKGILAIGMATGQVVLNNFQLNKNKTCTEILFGPVKDLNFHPSGHLLAVNSSDSLWKLFDVRETKILQEQQGHLGGVGVGSWHPDGAIYSTAGSSDGLIRLWDCRLGKSIWSVPSTPKSSVQISALSFSPLHPQILVSADADGLMSFHDLRKLEKEFMSTAAHLSCCSGLKFGAEGRVIVTGGFDGIIRFWSPGDARLIKELPVGLNSKVTSIDVRDDDDRQGCSNFKVAATTFDRSVKMFSFC